MEWTFLFFLNSVLLGVGLAMDAFSISLANGLNQPRMRRRQMATIAGVFGFFQALMPMLGWICVHTVLQYFQAFARFVPLIASSVLCILGGRMLYEGLHPSADAPKTVSMSPGLLLAQGVATSIDALSVGFTIADYDAVMALVCAAIIAAVTFVICMIGLAIGKKFGTKLANKASILGSVILILIGIEILVGSIF